MKVLLCVCLFLTVESAQIFGSQKSYDSYKTYRVEVLNPRHESIIRRLSADEDVDIWNDSWKVHRYADIMVHPRFQWRFEMILEANLMRFSVMIPDVELLLARQRFEQKIGEGRSSKGINFDRYYNYDEIQNYLRDLEKDYPSLVTVESLGRTSENRSQDIIIISSGGGRTKPGIFVDSAMHAREWAAPAATLYLIQQLVEFSDDNKELIDNVDWYIVPVSNPDGYQYSWNNDRMWRKTREEDVETGCIGTDGNRNYDYHWGESGSSSSPCSDIYKGSKPFSVAESRNLRNFEEKYKNQLKVYLAVHTYGQYILYPYSYDDVLPDDWRDLQKLGDEAAAAIRTVRGTEFDVGLSADLMGATAGSSDDYAKGALGIKYAYTIELYGGNYGFILPPSYIREVAEETFEAFKVFGTKFSTRS